MPTRPRLVRRAPLFKRIQAYLSPLDLLLWLSEELNSNDLEDTLKQWVVPAGLFMNVAFMVARANAKGVDPGEDVFADAYERRGSGWLAWFATFVVHLLTILSFTNAVYTFWRTRHYRLFENDVNKVPNTPSARRVHVDSSPMSSSPLRYFSDVLSTSTAQSRAHPDTTRDVWELRIWDPTPFCLHLFTLFSPGHIFVYGLFLPLDTLDPRPSVTIAKTLALNILLTIQLYLLQTSFTQQAKDSTLIHKELQNEYDTKYVHPTVQRPVRDVSTQCLTDDTPKSTHEVLVSTPRTYVNRGFNPHPNPAYASHYDPDSTRTSQFTRDPTRSLTTPTLRTPAMSSSADFSSPLRPTPGLTSRQPQIGPSAATGDGGYLGVHTHALSPLRKQALLGSEQKHRASAGPSDFRAKSPTKREGSSPLKRSSMPDLAQRQRYPAVKGGDVKRGKGARTWWER